MTPQRSAAGPQGKAGHRDPADSTWRPSSVSVCIPSLLCSTKPEALGFDLTARELGFSPSRSRSWPRRHQPADESLRLGAERRAIPVNQLNPADAEGRGHRRWPPKPAWRGRGRDDQRPPPSDGPGPRVIPPLARTVSPATGAACDAAWALYRAGLSGPSHRLGSPMPAPPHQPLTLRLPSPEGYGHRRRTGTALSPAARERFSISALPPASAGLPRVPGLAGSARPRPSRSLRRRRPCHRGGTDAASPGRSRPTPRNPEAFASSRSPPPFRGQNC